MFISEMPMALYFLGEQSGTPKGQVELNVLISFFFFSLCLSPAYLVRCLSICLFGSGS